MKILIIGGTRFVGPFVIDKLLKHKHNLTVFNRGTQKYVYDRKITHIKGDRNSKVNIPGNFDVVIDTCAYNANQLRNVLNGVSFDYFINFGTAASYKKTHTFPLTESSPLGEWPVWGDYNRGKVACERLLEKGSIKYSTIRPVYILGPANYVDRERFIYSKIINGEKIILPGNGQAVCQFIFAKEVADILVFLAENKLEGPFNCAGDDLITPQGLVEIMSRIAGKKAEVEFNNKADGLNYNLTEFPFANENFICSNEKLKQLDIKFLPLAETLRLDYKNYYKRIIK